MTPPLLYILHSGELFGTERMAVHTLAALAGRHDGIVAAPPGPIHEHARAHGLHSVVVTSPFALARCLWRIARAHRSFAVAATGLSQSLAVIAIRLLSRCRITHLHVVHGGTDECLSYGRKRLLDRFDVRFVAVSSFVRERLAAHGVSPANVTVIENFIETERAMPRPAFRAPGVRRVIVLSRLDRIKRVGLLIRALQRTPALAAMQFDVYGSGDEQDALRAAVASLPNVRLHGFQPDAARHLRDADLLVHTCAEEPFGLVVLEAFAAGVPVLVPNAGGSASLVRDGETGFHFAANDADALARALLELQTAPAAVLNGVAECARRTLGERFAPDIQAARYANLLEAAA